MTNDNLRRLIEAIRTGNPKLYHGDIKEGTIEALKQLEDLREILDDALLVVRPPGG